MKAEIQSHSKYFLVPPHLEALMKQRIDEYVAKNPTQKVVVIGIYETVNEVVTPTFSSVQNTQGNYIPYGFYDGLSNVHKQLSHFCLVADLPTQVSFDYEKLMLENGVLAFDNAQKLQSYLAT